MKIQLNDTSLYKDNEEGKCISDNPADCTNVRDGFDFADKIGMKLRTFNKCVEDGAAIPDPIDLYRGLWYEGELTALYADTNLGKSILAVQIGEHIASMGMKVIYVDIELSDKGVEIRSRHSDGTLHRFPDNFYRLTVNFTKILEASSGVDDNGFDILDRIEAVAQEEGARVIIIDNITALCAGVESGDTATRLVNRLLQMRNDNRWSILFIAHTPKLERGTPITRDSMGGSKRVISLIDSAFAVGQCLHDHTLRYIKQTKVRMGECRYHDNNVLCCQIDRVDGMLRFVPLDTRTEKSMLGEPKAADRSRKEKEVLRLFKNGLSQRQIASEAGVSRYFVNETLKNV